MLIRTLYFRLHHVSRFSRVVAPKIIYSSMVSFQKGPTHHAYAWQIGPFWQDTLDIWKWVWIQQMWSFCGDLWGSTPKVYLACHSTTQYFFSLHIQRFQTKPTSCITSVTTPPDTALSHRTSGPQRGSIFLYHKNCIQWNRANFLSNQGWSVSVVFNWPSLDKMAAISQTIFSNAFWWLKSFVFSFKFHWSLLLKVGLTIIKHWFR